MIGVRDINMQLACFMLVAGAICIQLWPAPSYRIAITILQNPSLFTQRATYWAPKKRKPRNSCTPQMMHQQYTEISRIYTTPPNSLEMPPKQDQLFLAPERPSHETKNPKQTPSMTQTSPFHSIIVATASLPPLTSLQAAPAPCKTNISKQARSRKYLRSKCNLSRAPHPSSRDTVSRASSFPQLGFTSRTLSPRTNFGGRPLVITNDYTTAKSKALSNQNRLKREHSQTRDFISNRET